ncbi:MAG: trypsin-like peptidase domain-containing protein [Lewinellaceae bacterium]|nr:trypsin-like peptidase domain-containing protein [Lewinellaceae bacterium]
MQNAQALYLKNIEGLVELNDLDKAIELLLKLDDEAQAGIRQDVILMSAQLKELERNVQRGLVSPLDSDYMKVKNRIRYGLTEMMKDIPRKIELYAQVRNLDTYQFNISEKVVGLEKIIGSKDNLLTISWLEKALQASKAVCKVVRGDGESGTGFITKEGYLFTNNHVLDNEDEAAAATIEFNYEVGLTGTIKPMSTYKLDATDFKTSPVPEFDFSRVKVIENGEKPLSDWGYLEFDPSAALSAGDAVTIIQHPSGGDKRIALRANEVVDQQAQYLYYTTDTEPGSSGSPVFNRDWKVVALHHAAKKINGRDANEGILFKNILGFLG